MDSQQIAQMQCLHGASRVPRSSSEEQTSQAVCVSSTCRSFKATASLACSAMKASSASLSSGMTFSLKSDPTTCGAATMGTSKWPAIASTVGAGAGPAEDEVVVVVVVEDEAAEDLVDKALA